MAPMEPWQRVWIDAKTYSQDVHSMIACTECHGGTAVDDFELAHEGMVDRPASNPETCGSCHTNLKEPVMNSLHTTLRGYDTVLHARSVPENHPALEEMQANHCISCHTTCGDCHISQPQNVGGGLLRAHTYVRTPPMSQTCTACHGSRVKDEYFGLNEGVPPDVHFLARMSCSDCHTSAEIHGVGIDPNHRYDGPQQPNCLDCHADPAGIGSGIEEHEIHGTEILSCQACHSTTYTNCVNCHVEKSPEGIPFFTVEDHFTGFVLGRNPRRSAERPYRFVPLRHVPIDVNSFSFYGENLLPNFDALPTWAYATPHNIQRIAPQARTCESCHANDDLFLTPDKVAPETLNANASVIVESAPPLPRGYVPAAPEEPSAPTGGGEDDFWGGSSGSSGSGDAGSSAEDDFWGDGSSATPQAPSSEEEDDEDFWGS